jgi:hypothetical protein
MKRVGESGSRYFVDRIREMVSRGFLLSLA